MDRVECSMVAIKICWLVIGHYIFDYLVQSRRVAMNKSVKLSVLSEHIFCYWFGMSVVGLFIGLNQALLYTFIIAMIHGIQDWFLWRSYKTFRKEELKTDTFKYWEDKVFYDFIGMDSTLHIITIIFFYILFI